MNATFFPRLLTRRAMLQELALAGAGALLSTRVLAQVTGQSDWRTALRQYLERHARLDGGYAWEGQDRSHLTPTFAVIGCYRALGETPPRTASLVEFARTHHPSQLKKLEQEHREFDWQQIQSLLWLGAEVSAFRDTVSRWKQPTVYLKQYEQHGCPILGHEVTAFTCRALLGMPLTELSSDYTAYLDSRRRANGSFNNTPARDGGDGHVMNTWWGLQALHTLGRTSEKITETMAWLRRCQRPSGGFTWQPQPDFAGVDDAAYTWAAVQALRLLGSEPADRESCVRYLLSLANADGGFGDRPGWQSNPVATFYALEALSLLGALDRQAVATPRALARPTPLPANLKVFSIQLEAHGKGSPAEAVDLARALRIHLWGAKNAKPEWLTQAQQIADSQTVPVRFFLANEEYGTWVNLPGFGTYSHTSDIIVPAGKSFGDSLANQGVVSWPEFRQRRLDPLQRAGGRLVWQFGENEELVRLFLDDSLERGGYAAISTFHFGNPDFTNSEPFLHRYRGRIPFVALQDAHGDEPWWFADMTTGFRTLFLATEPSWDAWLQALERNWVAAVRHDAVSGFRTWVHTGSAAVRDCISRHEEQWRWWDNSNIARPMVSLVALRPGDVFEAGRPEQGTAVRVRCAFENTTQGRPKKPLAQLRRLLVDGQEVSPKLIAPRQAGGPAFGDHYHLYQMQKPDSGKHTASVEVEVLETKATVTRSIEFVV
jgi:hypothetical protein